MKYVYTLVLTFASSSFVPACGGDEPARMEDDDAPEPTAARDAGARDAGARDGAARDGAAADAAKRDTGPSEPEDDAGSGQMPSDARTDRAPPGDPGGACGEVGGSSDAAALHQAALDVLGATAPCGGSSCHAGRGKAGLSLLGAMDLRALLVDKPACEAPTLSLVDGSGGAGALANSWLWQKLTSDVDAQMALPEEASWGTSGNCGQSPDEPYGLLMPLGGTMLSEARLAPIRAWICAGAPGPD